MCKLKAFNCVESDVQEFCEPRLAYLKSEADKVIAEKDAKILALDAEVFKQKHHAKLFLDERNYAETQLRHHKYKRCLAMAKWCKLEQERIELIECQDITDDDFNKLVKGFYKKWHKRWLKLAEQFKDKEA